MIFVKKKKRSNTQLQIYVNLLKFADKSGILGRECRGIGGGADTGGALVSSVSAIAASLMVSCASSSGLPVYWATSSRLCG